MAFLLDERFIAEYNHNKPVVFEDVLPTIGNDYGDTYACDNAKSTKAVTLRTGAKDCVTLVELQELIDVIEGPPGSILGPIIDHSGVSHEGIMLSLVYRGIEGVADLYEGVVIQMREFV